MFSHWSKTVDQKRTNPRLFTDFFKSAYRQLGKKMFATVDIRFVR